MTEEELRELLPERDVDYILSKELVGRLDVRRVGAEVHVVFRNYEFPSHYVPTKADLLVKLISPYPNSNPDMFWTRPDVKLASGHMPQGSEVREVPAPPGHESVYDGVAWQRWSRHFQGQPWRSGADGLRTYMASIRLELVKGR